MNRVYISYAGHRLAIEIEVPELRENVVTIFDKLITHPEGPVFHTLRVNKMREGFIIDGAHEMEAHATNHRTALQQLKFEIIHQFIKLTPNQLWLHAAAASLNGHGILLSGSWGKGKSTIVSELCARGALYLSDDIVPVDMESGQLMPFHLTPMRREADQAHTMLSPLEISTLTKHIIDVPQDGYASNGVQLSALIFPEYIPEVQTTLQPHSPAQATMTLLENCLNLKTKKAEAVHYLGKLIERTPVYHLPYSNGPQGAQLIANLIAQQPQTSIPD